MTEINNWIPYGVTDFANPLAKRVDEHTRQIAEDTENKIAQSKQIEEADPDVTSLKTVGGVLDFGKVATTYIGRQQRIAKTAEAKNQTLTNNTLQLLASGKDDKLYLDKWLTYKASVKDINASTEGYDDLIKGLENVNPKLIDYLKRANPKEVLRIKESRISNYVTNEATPNWKAYYNGLSEKERLDFEKTIAGNPGDIKKKFYEINAKKLSTLGISNELLIGSGSFASLQKQAETISSLDAAAYNIKSLTTEGVLFQEKIDLAKTKINVDGNSFSQVLQTQINNEDKDTVLARLALAASKGDFNHIELSSMREGLIVHPSGDIVVKKGDKYNEMGFEVGTKLGKGQLLFNPDQWSKLTKIINAKNAASVKANEAQNDLNITNAIALAGKNQLTEQSKAIALLSYLNNGGSDEDQLYKDLSNLSLNHQSADYYKQEQLELFAAIEDGQIDTVMSNIDSIKNNQLKLEFKKKKTDYNIALKQSGYSVGFEDEARSDLKKVISTKIVQGEAIPTGSPRTAYNYIARNRARIFAEEFFKGEPNDPTLGSRVEQRVEAFLASKGFGEATDSPNAGILTANTVGEFPALDAYVNSFAEVDSTASKRIDLTLAELSTAFKKINGQGVNAKDKALNTKGLLLNDSELVAIRNFGFKDGQFQGFPEDVLIKAEVLGIQPSVLVLRQLNALLTSTDKNDQLLVKVNDLDKLGEVLNEMSKKNEFPDVKLREIIEETGDKDLLYGYEHLGIKGLTNNQIQRLNSFETAIDQNINVQERNLKITKAIELDKTRGVEEALRRFNVFVNKYESGKTRYPNGVTREHIKWDKETKSWELIND